jgi:hypothetical protein
MQGQAKPPLWILSWTVRCTDWYMGGVALSGFGSVVNAKAKVKGPLAERLLRPRSNALPTFHSSSMVTHHSGGRNAAIFLKERFVRGRTI